VEALDEGKWSKELLEAGMKLVPAHAKGDHRAITSKTDDAVSFSSSTAMASGGGGDAERLAARGRRRAFIFAGKVAGEEKPRATHYYLQQPDPFGHFIYLVKAIESTIRTGHAAYPVERTLLTTGILDAVMTSKAEKNRRVETPHLAIKYTPTDWPFATDPVPKAIKR
jgi:hypothetical protein